MATTASFSLETTSQPRRAAYLNQIATAVPGQDVHDKFVEYAQTLLPDDRHRAVFKRMANRSQIEHRYSVLKTGVDTTQLDDSNFYQTGNFPSTGARMRMYEQAAFPLAKSALDQLNLGAVKDEITHLIVTTCTGFYAPGIDLQIVQHYGLKLSVERTVVGFMGCYAALNALKLARHIVRSEPASKVLVVNLELCTLHLQETDNLEQVLSFLIFADGCAAGLVSADPIGLELDRFYTTVFPDSLDQITWHIGDGGFDMVLSGQLAQSITQGLPCRLNTILDGCSKDDIRHWAIHPGGRSILDAVQEAVGLAPGMLAVSRDVLRRFGNMSSATLMFVLKEMLAQGFPQGRGCAMGFGPGVTVETMLFETVE